LTFLYEATSLIRGLWFGRILLLYKKIIFWSIKNQVQNQYLVVGGIGPKANNTCHHSSRTSSSSSFMYRSDISGFQVPNIHGSIAVICNRGQV